LKLIYSEIDKILIRIIFFNFR